MSLFGPKPLTRKNLKKVLDKCNVRIFADDLEQLYNDLVDSGPAGLDDWNIYSSAKERILEQLEIPRPRRRELVLDDYDEDDYEDEYEENYEDDYRNTSEASETAKKVAATTAVGAAAFAAGFWRGYNAPPRKKWSLLD